MLDCMPPQRQVDLSHVVETFIGKDSIEIGSAKVGCRECCVAAFEDGDQPPEKAMSYLKRDLRQLWRLHTG